MSNAKRTLCANSVSKTELGGAAGRATAKADIIPSVTVHGAESLIDVAPTVDLVMTMAMSACARLMRFGVHEPSCRKNGTGNREHNFVHLHLLTPFLCIGGDCFTPSPSH